MSLTDAERRHKRAHDLTTAIIRRPSGWLPGDADLDQLLPEDHAIVPYYIAERMWNPDEDKDPADVVVAVRTTEGASERQNTREETTHIVDVEVAATTEWVENYGGTLAVEQIRGRVADILTRHREGWTASGVSGGTDGIGSDADRNRYAGVSRFDFARDDTHPFHDPES